MHPVPERRSRIAHPAIMPTPERDWSWPQALNPSADGAHGGLRHGGATPGGSGLRRTRRALLAELGRRAPGLTLGAASRQVVPRPDDPPQGVRSVALDLLMTQLEAVALALEPLRSRCDGDQHRSLLQSKSGLQPEKRPAPG